MIKVVYTNIESKIKIGDLLSDPMLGVGFLLSMNIVVEVLDNFINADKRIKGIQIGDHKIKIVNFADNTIIFLRKDITCLNRIKVILYENARIN